MSDQPIADDLVDEESAGAPIDAEADLQTEEQPEQVGEAEELPPSVEELLIQRDGFLNDLQRVTAEFANYRRKAAERQQEREAAAEAGIVEKMLPVLDACEAAVAQGVEDVISDSRRAVWRA